MLLPPRCDDFYSLSSEAGGASSSSGSSICTHTSVKSVKGKMSRNKYIYSTKTWHADEDACVRFLDSRPTTLAKLTKYSRDRLKRYQYRHCTCKCGYVVVVVTTVGVESVQTWETDVPDNHHAASDDSSSEGVNPSTTRRRMDRGVASMIVEVLEANRHTKNFGACKILTELRLRNVPEDKMPSKRQITNKICYHRKSRFQFNNLITPLEERLRRVVFDADTSYNNGDLFKQPFVFCYDHDSNNR